MSVLDTGRMIMKEYLDKDYVLRLIDLKEDAYNRIPSDWIEVPQGALMLIKHPNGREVWSYSDSKVNPLNEVIWQRPTKPEELPFVDDEPKGINKGLAKASEKMKNKSMGFGFMSLKEDDPKAKVSIGDQELTGVPTSSLPNIEHMNGCAIGKTLSLNDTYAEIEQVRQNSKLDQSISDFKNTDHGKEFDKFDLFVDEPQRENSHYFIDVSDVDEVDFYEIAKRYNVTDPAIQHILKKCLAIGNRGHKDLETDLKDILKTAKRALEINGIK